jgi:hypothetical protein
MGRNNESTSIDYKSLVLEYLYTYYDEEIIDYLRTITHMYNITVEEGLDLFGCFESTSNDDILLKLNIIVPKPYDIKSSSVFVHEYKHGIDLYPYIGKDISGLIENNRDVFEELAKKEEKTYTNYLVKRLSNEKH